MWSVTMTHLYAVYRDLLWIQRHKQVESKRMEKDIPHEWRLRELEWLY